MKATNDDFGHSPKGRPSPVEQFREINGRAPTAKEMMSLW